MLENLSDLCRKYFWSLFSLDTLYVITAVLVEIKRQQVTQLWISDGRFAREQNDWIRFSVQFDSIRFSTANQLTFLERVGRPRYC